MDAQSDTQSDARERRRARSSSACARRSEHEFGAGPEVIARAPGRVNLIGEHTDYNDGFVLPVAIDREVRVAARRRPDARCASWPRTSGGAAGSTCGTSATTRPSAGATTSGAWPLMLQREGYALGGFEAVVEGEVPSGAGLSSSAAVEVATATALKALFGLDLDPVRLVPLEPAGGERVRRRRLRDHGPVYLRPGAPGPRPVPGLPLPGDAPRPAARRRGQRPRAPDRGRRYGGQAGPGGLGVQPAPGGVRGGGAAPLGGAPRGARPARRVAGGLRAPRSAAPGCGAAPGAPRDHGERQGAGQRRGPQRRRPAHVRAPDARESRQPAGRLPGDRAPAGRPGGGGPRRAGGAGLTHDGGRVRGLHRQPGARRRPGALRARGAPGVPPAAPAWSPGSTSAGRWTGPLPSPPPASPGLPRPDEPAAGPDWRARADE